MKVVIIGGGGREHALAWALSRSVTDLAVTPGNAGTPAWPPQDPDTADLVVVGPEAPLAEGIAARWPGKVFGPSQQAAEIESSKAFAKAFMQRHGIPSAAHQTFSELEPALRYARQGPVVIKASGLAAGKGVVLPEPHEVEEVLRRILVEREFGEAGAQVVVEERLEGPEVSLLAFTDGKTVRLFPTAADHKRLLDGDRGPNTGGMGAYAPARCVDGRAILQKAIDGLASEGRPFVGVLYAGLMLTREGPKVLEFNCRLGDPETQVLLPLLETPLLEILQACVEGRLDELEPRWKSGCAACVVAAAPGYPQKPETGRQIQLGEDLPDTLVFHAGTRAQDGRVLTAGGRVLGVTGLGQDLPTALQRAYRRLETIRFEGMQIRRDIGR